MHFWDQILDLVQMAYTPTLSIVVVEPEKAVAFDQMRLKSKLILTLGEFLATSVSLLIALLGGADTTLKIYFKNSHVLERVLNRYQ